MFTFDSKGQLVAMATITPPTVKRVTTRRRISTPRIQKEVPVTKQTITAPVSTIGSLTTSQIAEAIETGIKLGLVVPAPAPHLAPAPVAAPAPAVRNANGFKKYANIGTRRAREIIENMAPERLYNENSPLWLKQGPEVKSMFAAAKLSLSAALAAKDIVAAAEAQEYIQSLEDARANRSFMYKVGEFETVEEAEAFVRSI